MKCNEFSYGFMSQKNISFYDERYVNGDYGLKATYFYYTTFFDRKLKNHSHTDAEIMGVLSGECVIPVGDREVTLKKGQAIFIDCNQPHGLLIDKSCKMYCIQLSFVPTSGVVSFGSLAKNDKSLERFLKNKRGYIVFDDVEDISSTIKTLNNAQRYSDSYGYSQLLASEVVLKLARCVVERAEQVSASFYNVKKAMEFMEGNLHLGINVKETADYLGLEQSYFGRMFKKQTGVSPIDYLNQCRLKKAKILLDDGDMSISEICAQIGVSTRQYFTYLFTKYEGITPREYKKNRHN